MVLTLYLEQLLLMAAVAAEITGQQPVLEEMVGPVAEVRPVELAQAGLEYRHKDIPQQIGEAEVQVLLVVVELVEMAFHHQLQDLL
jgi:hypothetical protein